MVPCDVGMCVIIGLLLLLVFQLYLFVFSLFSVLILLSVFLLLFLAARFTIWGLESGLHTPTA